MAKKNTIILVEDEKIFAEAIVKTSENYEEFEIMEKKIDKAISEALNQFNTNPKLKRHYRCLANIISLAIQFDDYNLKQLYSKVAPMVNLKNSSGVNSLVSRYLNELTKKNDPIILEQIFKSCHNPQSPTAKEFIFTIAKEVKNKLGNI